jgi:hypothetical protein
MAIALAVACSGEVRAQAAAPRRSTTKSTPALDRRLIVVAFDAPDTLSFSAARRVARAITEVCARRDLRATAYEEYQLVPTPEGVGDVNAQTFREVARLARAYVVLNILARTGRDSARVVGTLHFANPSFASSRSEVTASSLDAAIPILACGLVADARLR